MQFIEKNVLDVRSAVFHLCKDGEDLEFILFPMIHVGEKKYYAEIHRRLSACDLILAEGVKSKKAALLIFSYRVIEKIRSFDLVTQRALKISDFGEKVLNADMAGQTFDSNWSSLPLRLRALLFFVIPFYISYLYFRGTRSFIAQHIAFDDLPSRDEILLTDESWEAFNDVVVAQRDRVLIEKIERLYEEQHTLKKVIGIVYGAGHMRAIADYLLNKLEYRVIKAEWVRVFEL